MELITNSKSTDKDKNLITLIKIHSRAVMRLTKEYSTKKSIDTIKKRAYHSVMLSNSVYRVLKSGFEVIPDEEIQFMFSLMELTIEHIKLLTPQDLMQLFPVEKIYDGNKKDTKDYFSTMNALMEHGLDTPIGEAADDILWDYVNKNLKYFQKGHLHVASRLYKKISGKGIIEELAEKNGISSYTLATDLKTGKKYLINNSTNEITRVRKPIPRYIKIVNGNYNLKNKMPPRKEVMNYGDGLDI